MKVWYFPRTQTTKSSYISRVNGKRRLMASMSTLVCACPESVSLDVIGFWTETFPSLLTGKPFQEMRVIYS